MIPSPAISSAPRVRCAASRGITFIEVVMAVALLAVGSGMLLGAVGFTNRAEQLDTHRLNANEVAHRILIDHLQTFSKFTNKQQRRFELNGFMYAFDFELFILTRSDDGQGVSRRSRQSAIGASKDEVLRSRLHQASVKVWLDEPSISLSGKPLVIMSRIYDPLSGDEDQVILFLKELLAPELDAQ